MSTSTGVSGVVVIEGHVQGLANTRALGRSGIPVIVVSEHDCLAHYSRYTKKFFRCPAYLDEKFTGFLIELAKREGLKNWVLLPSNDHAVFNISRNRHRLEEFFRIISPPPDILENIYNKESLIKLCRDSDIPVPATWFPAAGNFLIEPGLKFPLLVKGKHGLTFYRSTGRKAFLAADRGQLAAIMKNLEPVISPGELFLQELLPVLRNKPVSFTAFSIDGRIMASWTGIKVREHPLTFGTATYSRSIHIPGLREVAGRLLEKLRFTGVCEIEFLPDPADSEYKLIEMNARTWLWVDMAVRDGVNYPMMVYNYLNGEEADYPADKEHNSAWIHYVVDLPYAIAGLVKGHYTPAELIKSYLSLPKPAVLDPGDPLPSLAELILLPQFLFKR